MSRVRNGRKRWRKKWPWKRLFPLRVDDRFCSECSLPYHEGPLPEDVKRFNSGNVTALIYPAGQWGLSKYSVKFGRWKPQSRGPFLSEYFTLEDLQDLAQVTAQAHRYMKNRSNQRRLSTSPRKNGSRRPQV